MARPNGEARTASLASGSDQHALGQESISLAPEKRRALPRSAQRAFGAGARCRGDRRRAGGRAKLFSRARLAVAQSERHSGEAARGAAAAAGLRPRACGVVSLSSPHPASGHLLPAGGAKDLAAGEGPSLRIGILGTRGVPPRYGGFETFAAELGTRLVRRGHRVAVYCRVEGEKTWNGIQRIVLPSIPHKYFETVSHAFLSALDAMQQDFDVVLLCNAANAFVLPLLRAARIPTAINVDGIERHRRKWNAVGRAVYAVGETLSAQLASAVLADAEVIAAYYRTRRGIDPVPIPYGSEFPDER